VPDQGASAPRLTVARRVQPPIAVRSYHTASHPSSDAAWPPATARTPVAAPAPTVPNLAQHDGAAKMVTLASQAAREQAPSDAIPVLARHDGGIASHHALKPLSWLPSLQAGPLTKSPHATETTKSLPQQPVAAAVGDSKGIDDASPAWPTRHALAMLAQEALGGATADWPTWTAAVATIICLGFALFGTRHLFVRRAAQLRQVRPALPTPAPDISISATLVDLCPSSVYSMCPQPKHVSKAGDSCKLLLAGYLASTRPPQPRQQRGACLGTHQARKGSSHANRPV
jgi:hypothetical protein